MESVASFNEAGPSTGRRKKSAAGVLANNRSRPKRNSGGSCNRKSPSLLQRQRKFVRDWARKLRRMRSKNTASDEPSPRSKAELLEELKRCASLLHQENDQPRPSSANATQLNGQKAHLTSSIHSTKSETDTLSDDPIPGYCVLFELPIEIWLQILDYIKPHEWMILEQVCRWTKFYVAQKCNDVVGLDLAQDYLIPLSRAKYKYRLLKTNMYKLIPFLGPRFRCLESLTFCDCNIKFDASTGVSILQALGSVSPKLQELHFVNKAHRNGNGPDVSKKRNGTNIRLIVEQPALSGLLKGQYTNLRWLNIDGCIYVPSGPVSQEFQITHEAFPNLQKLFFRRCTGMVTFSDSFLNKGRLLEVSFERFFNCSWLQVWPLVQFLASPCAQSLTDINLLKVDFYDRMGSNLVHDVFQLPNLRVVEMGQANCWHHWIAPEDDGPSIKCHNLEILLLPEAPFLSKKFLKAVCDNCPYISCLSLAAAPAHFSDDDYRIVESLSNLIDLNVSDSEIKDKTIDSLAKKLKNLTHLNIRGCKFLTNESLKSLAFDAKKLECLYLRRKGRKIDEQGLQILLDNCKTLKRLELTGKVLGKLNLPKRDDFEIFLAANWEMT